MKGAKSIDLTVRYHSVDLATRLGALTQAVVFGPEKTWDLFQSKQKNVLTKVRGQHQNTGCFVFLSQQRRRPNQFGNSSIFRKPY